MKRFILLAFYIGVFSADSFAQYDSIVNAFQKKFVQFKQSAIQKQNGFISHNDSVFLSFLKESWKQVDVFQQQSKDEPKPVNQPEIKADTLSQKLEYIQPKATPIVSDVKADTFIGKLMPVKFDSRMVINAFDFYGQQEKIAYSPQVSAGMQLVNEDEIAHFYQTLVKNSSLWGYNLGILLEARIKYRLNDWGYYQLVRSASQSVFIRTNEQRLLCWYLLLKSGYNVKVGFERNEVYLLIPSIQKLYNILYVAEPGQTFYAMDVKKTKLENFHTYVGEYPGSNRLFSFDLPQYPQLGGNTISKTVKYNGQNIQLFFLQMNIDFLNTYPLCDLNAYFHSGISETNMKILDKFLTPLLSGKNEVEKVNLLLDFCQHALEYKTDQEQFGTERYLFAEESLFYPYCDCEDRSVLLSALVKRYTGLHSVALDFPGHVALAVQFSDDVHGDYYVFRNEKYTVCDPTYIGAKCGMLPVEFKNIKTEIITF